MGVSAVYSAPCGADKSRSEPCTDMNTPTASHWTFGRKYTQTRCSLRSQTRFLQRRSFRYAQSSDSVRVLTRDEQDFERDIERARRWRVLRQDSGDPFVFAPRAKEVYERLGINYRERTIIYSDSLDLEKTLALKKHCEEIGFIRLSSRPLLLNRLIIHAATFGIGTFFTNDFKSLSSKGKEKSRALNMVIKLASANGLPCIKISDDLMKASLLFLY
jgi:nicotinic acid phosphoribosyltransferase